MTIIAFTPSSFQMTFNEAGLMLLGQNVWRYCERLLVFSHTTFGAASAIWLQASSRRVVSEWHWSSL